MRIYRVVDVQEMVQALWLIIKCFSVNATSFISILSINKNKQGELKWALLIT